MKPMPFNDDLEMWHKFAEFAEYVKFVSEAQELQLYSQCVWYSYDRGTCEVSCSHPLIKRDKEKRG